MNSARDRGSYAGGQEPGLVDINGPGIADDLPDTLSPMLAVGKEVFSV